MAPRSTDGELLPRVFSSLTGAVLSIRIRRGGTGTWTSSSVVLAAPTAATSHRIVQLQLKQVSRDILINRLVKPTSYFCKIIFYCK